MVGFSSVEPSHIISTTAAAGPLQDPIAFRALVLTWLGVVAAVLLAVRPLLLDIVDLVWALKRDWNEHGSPDGVSPNVSRNERGP